MMTLARFFLPLVALFFPIFVQDRLFCVLLPFHFNHVIHLKKIAEKAKVVAMCEKVTKINEQSMMTKKSFWADTYYHQTCTRPEVFVISYLLF